jgi:SAM-dependent methyltransferase
LSRLLRRYFDYIMKVDYDRRIAAQMDILQKEQDALYLDCGCYGGIKTSRFAERIGTHQVVGIDYIARLLDEAHKRGIATLRGDLNKPLPLRESVFNVVTAFDVIEHISETSTFVAEVFRVLAPGGCLILDTPNLASWQNIFALLLGIQPFSGPNITTMVDADLDIVRRMHRQNLKLPEEGEIADEHETQVRRHIVVLAFHSALNLLRRNGFVIERALGYGYLPFPPIIARVLVRMDPAHAHHMFIKARKPSN